MSLLLDTQSLLWLFRGNSRLGVEARRVIADEPILIVSEISLLEISLKVATGKLPKTPGLVEGLVKFGIRRTGITDAYLAKLESLPFHHRDPFDRFLIAQAICDDLRVVTSDRAFAQYGVRVVDARA